MPTTPPPTPLTVANRVFYQKSFNGNGQAAIDSINRLIVDVLEPANRMVIDWHLEIDARNQASKVIVIRTAPC